MQTRVDLENARKWRDEVLNKIAANRKSYVDDARAYAIAYAKQYGTVTVMDVRKAKPIPPTMDPRVIGGVFRTKKLTPVGYASNETAHGRAVRKFAYSPEHHGSGCSAKAVGYDSTIDKIDIRQIEGVWCASEYHVDGVVFSGYGKTPATALQDVNNSKNVFMEAYLNF